MTTDLDLGKPCRGCGAAVFGGGVWCSVCEAKDWNIAPKAAMETAPQPTPAYQREDDNDVDH